MTSAVKCTCPAPRGGKCANCRSRERMTKLRSDPKTNAVLVRRKRQWARDPSSRVKYLACKRRSEVKRRLKMTLEQKARDRAAKLGWKYGLTGDQVLALLRDRACDICGKTGRLDIDHRGDAVRGALCTSCNRRLLPALENLGHLLDRAIAYLANPPGIYGRLTAVAS